METGRDEGRGRESDKINKSQLLSSLPGREKREEEEEQLRNSRKMRRKEIRRRRRLYRRDRGVKR